MAKAPKKGAEAAQQTFRQFAWNLASTIAQAKQGGKAAGGGKR